MNSHLSQDELLDQVYGLRSDDSHVRNCADCSSRLQALLETKARLGVEPPVSNEFLTVQRRAIYARLDRAAAAQMRWAPAFAVACVLAMGLLLYRPQPASQYQPERPAETTAARVELNNEQLLSDLYSMEESVEPRAAAPIHGLFEETSGSGEQ
jgi:hypothetical protein